MTIPNDEDQDDDLSIRLQREALETLEQEPMLTRLLQNTVLPTSEESLLSLEDAVAYAISFRLMDSKHTTTTAASSSSSSSSVDPDALRTLFVKILKDPNHLEGGHTISFSIRSDLKATMDRDPACQTLLEVVLFFKGFAALVGHRVANCLWHRSSRMMALWLQSACSASFGMDLHPAATIGAGVLLDHGTGIVIGETAVVGDGCTILHGVTLGGTGKESGDRHPKVGKHVLIGAGASILGNIPIGQACKIGAGSVVLRALPPGATAVGAPAKIIGRTIEKDPASSMDRALSRVALFHNPDSSSTSTTTTTTTMESEPSSSSTDEDHDDLEGIMVVTGETSKNWCPFRLITAMSKRAPPGTITIVSLRKLLLPEGCSRFEVDSLFFQLDVQNVGYVHRAYFAKHGPEAMETCCTTLPPERIQALVSNFMAHHPMSLKEHGKEKGSLHVSLTDLS